MFVLYNLFAVGAADKLRCSAQLKLLGLWTGKLDFATSLCSPPAERIMFLAVPSGIATRARAAKRAPLGAAGMLAVVDPAGGKDLGRRRGVAHP